MSQLCPDRKSLLAHYGGRRTDYKSGGAIGLALGNAVLQNVFVAGLPPLDETATASLRSSFDSSVALSEDQRNAVEEACECQSSCAI